MLRRASVRWVAATAALVLGVGVGVGVVVAVDASQSSSTRTAAGTSVGGLPAAGLDRRGLVELLASAQRRAPAVLTINAGSRSLRLPRSELGVTVDVEATARRVLDESGAGRGIGALGRRPGRAVAPVLVTDAARLEQTIDRITAGVRAAPFNGSISFDDGLVVKAPSSGQLTDAAAVSEALRTASQRLPPMPAVTLPVTPVASRVEAGAFRRAIAQARAVLARPVILQAGTRRTQIPSRALGPQLTINLIDAQPSLALRRTAVQQLAVPAAVELSREPRAPRLSAPSPTPLLSTQGDVSWRPRPARVSVSAPGSAGQNVTVRAVLEALSRQLRAATPTTAVPSTQVPPADVRPGQLNAVLGTFTTRYACCQGRVTNIRRIAQVVDGTVIGPGQSFSLNGIAGRRTRAKGYVDAPFILDGELSSDVGGGVSQFATTAFNAAFFAGVRLDEHQAHSFYISRYPAGREATVNFPGIDLRWTNTTPSPILVRASTTATTVTVALYGRDDGRSVQALTGDRRSIAGRDFAITVTRVLTRPGRPTDRDRFTTVYNDSPDS